MDYSEFVHEYTDADGKTRYVVAQHVGNQYIAPLTKKGRWLTGANYLLGHRPVDVVGGTYTYARRRDAIRRARYLYGYVDED